MPKRHGVFHVLYTENIIPGALHSNFLALNPGIILLYFKKADFVGFKSQLIVTPKSDSSCLVDISGLKMHNFTFVKIGRHLLLWRPLTDLVKVFFDDSDVGCREGLSPVFFVINIF